MSLTSSSTLADALAQWNDNLSWEGNSLKISLAIEAARWLLVNRGRNLATMGRSINYDDIAAQLKRLEAHGDAVRTSNRSTFTRGRMV